MSSNNNYTNTIFWLNTWLICYDKQEQKFCFLMFGQIYITLKITQTDNWMSWIDNFAITTKSLCQSIYKSIYMYIPFELSNGNNVRLRSYFKKDYLDYV